MSETGAREAPDLRVVFDLDDTLYPERAFALSGFRAAEAWARTELGIESDLAGHMTALLDGGGLGGIFRTCLAHHRPGHTAAELEGFIEAYRRHEPCIELFDDAPDALEHCAALGPLGLVTDGTERVQRSKVRALGIAERFHTIVYTQALGGRAYHKPHPRAFEVVEAALAGPGRRLVYVGDNPAKDFVAPNQRGWITIQVRRERTIHDTSIIAAGGEPQHTIDSLDELAPLLARLARG